MADGTRRVYWDTSVFLCFLNDKEQTRRKICEDVLDCAMREEVKIFTSCYTIAEVIRPKARSIPMATRLTPVEIAQITAMFRWPFLTTIEVDDRLAHFAVSLARAYDLKPADSVHAASAILWRLDTLYAWDRDFSRVAHMISVEEPRFLTPPTLFRLLDEAEAAVTHKNSSPAAGDAAGEANGGPEKLVAAVGIEPTTRGFTGNRHSDADPRSTTELHSHTPVSDAAITAQDSTKNNPSEGSDKEP